MKSVPRSMLFSLALSACLATPLFAAQDYFQGWDIPGDAAGWIPNTISCDVSAIGCCGNPGGFINSFRISGQFAEIGITSELPDVSGDYAAAGVTGVSFDLYNFGGVSSARFRVRYQDSTFNGWSYLVTPSLPTSGWQSYSIAFDPTWTDAEAILAGWESDGPGTPDFATTMSNVYHPEIRAFDSTTSGPTLNGFGGLGVDNFHLIADTCADDTDGPDVDIVLSRDVLWPPNHKQVEVCATVNVDDNCDDNPTVALVSVTSNEPDNGQGDGDTAGDIEILSDTCFNLRSERAGSGSGRKYTITYSVTDAAGNETVASACVTVPHSQNAKAMAGAGFSPTGGAILSYASQYTLVVPSGNNLEARTINPDRVFVGNHLGSISPSDHYLLDVTGDRSNDLVLIFNSSPTMDLLAATTASAALEGMPDSDAPIGTILAKPLSVSLYFEAGNASYLISDILNLGSPKRLSGGGGNDREGLRPEGPSDGLDPGSGTVTLTAGGSVVVEVFNIQGRKIRTLVNGDMAAGTHSLAWDGLDDAGRKASAGIYFTRLIAPGIDQTKKVMVTSR